MTDLIWNEGMSVGIDVIDEDHKQIIAILAKLTSAHHNQISKQAIADIFSELEQYVILHFAREEALLEKVCYRNIAEHKASHQKFIEHLPVLKSQWLSEDNLTCSGKITTFLHKWIVNHILVEDLDYAPALFNSSDFSVAQLKTETNEQEKQSIYKVLSNNVAQKIPLCRRIFITAFIPIIGVLLLSFIILQSNYQQYKNLSQVVSVNDVILQVNRLTQSLQTERAISANVYMVNAQTDRKNLVESRLITDHEFTELFSLIQHDVAPAVALSIKRNPDFTPASFDKIKGYRQKFDRQSIDFLQTYHAYNTLIAKLLLLTENLLHVDMSTTLANDISVIGSVLFFEEYLGQIKAQGLTLLHAGNDKLQDDIAINQLIGKQLHTLRMFANLANEQQQKICADLCEHSKYTMKLSQVFSEVEQKQTLGQATSHWLDFMLVETEKLKKTTDQLITEFDHKVLAQYQKVELNFIIAVSVLSVFLFVAVFVTSILNHSIIHPVRRLTAALNSMAKGKRNTQFKNTVVDDEIGAMQAAYEKLRRKLLQIDIFEALVNSQEKEIAYRKSQQQHFEVLAYTDSLTGAVNRHQFSTALAEAISHANYEQQPLSILLLDIDYFKQVNDNFGHGVGDDVLVMFYKACKEAVRSGDVVARIGGEEFVIILPNSELHSATQFAERLRKKIEELTIKVDEKVIKLTVSIGVSQWLNEVFSGAEAFVADADKLLYQAKAQGRNSVVARNQRETV